jgi:2-desacetyl-2-hydroxyethyl bacteriochlorophyllide A dehydrogenase
MLGAVYRGPGLIEPRGDLPVPAVAGPRDALVRITRSAVCGTDLHAYRGELPDFAEGTVLGHEFTGIVADAGVAAGHAPGSRVVGSDVVACGHCPACAGGRHYQCAEVTLFGYSTVVGRPLAGAQADYVLVPNADIVLAPVPDALSDEQALFTGDVLATAYQACLVGGVRPGDVVVVVGGGAVGTLAGMCALVAGAGTVIVADPHAGRRAALARHGLLAVEPGDVATAAPRGARVVIEAVGSDAALGLAMTAAAPSGTVIVVGAHHASACPFPTGIAFARELTVKFVVGDPILVREDLFALIGSGRLDPAEIISHRLPLADVAYGYRIFDRQEATKVVLVND